MKVRSGGLALLLAVASGCSEPEAVDSRSVVLVTLDTTRADALLAFGGEREVAPALEALARESICFTNARTVAPLTLPAHASMFTGLYPPRHGVRNNGPASLSSEADTLAEHAARAGFQTAGFVGSLALDRAYGAAQGFDAWTQPAGGDDRVRGQISDRVGSDVIADDAQRAAFEEPFAAQVGPQVRERRVHRHDLAPVGMATGALDVLGPGDIGRVRIEQVHP